ncbi:tetratricopeptide repeat protein [Rapidithrix thailandica]|uniref:Tetratricopeptide repeat protein n=1 Tax=Rapidithrix thailandica TaxID=413964 RepID=A0AAW9S028_9BACT
MSQVKRLIIAFLFNVFFVATAFSQGSDALDIYVQAEKYRQAKNYKAAIEEYNKAIQKDPKNHKFVFQKAKCYLAIGDKDNALNCFAKTAELNEKYVDAYTWQANLYQERKDIPNTILNLDKAFQFETDQKKKVEYKVDIIKLLYKSGKFDATWEHIQDAKSQDENDLRVLYFEAHFANRNEKYHLAQVDMEKAITLLDSKDPKEISKYYYELGYAYHHLEEYQKAKETFAKANYGPFKGLILELGPQFNYSVAYAFYQIYDLKRSLELVDYTLKIDPHYSAAHDLKVRIAEAFIDKSAIIDQTKSALSSQQGNEKWIAAKYFEMAEIELQAGKYGDAIASIEECLKLEPHNYNATFILAVSKYKSSLKDEAKDLLANAVTSHGVDHETKAKFHFTLGQIYKDLDDKKMAEEAFKAAHFGLFKYAAMKEIKSLKNEVNVVSDDSGEITKVEEETEF